MTRFEFGDIILVPFPFTDQTFTKKRPAVAISGVSYNIERPDIIIMAVTSRGISAMHVKFLEETRYPGCYYRTGFPEVDDDHWKVFVN